MAGALQPREPHDRQETADMQTRRGWIEPDIRGDRPRRHRVAEPFGHIVEELAPLQFRNQIHLFAGGLRPAGPPCTLTRGDPDPAPFAWLTRVRSFAHLSMRETFVLYRGAIKWPVSSRRVFLKYLGAAA